MEKTLTKTYQCLTDEEKRYLYKSRLAKIPAWVVAKKINVPQSTATYWRRRIADEIEGRVKPKTYQRVVRYERDSKKSIIPFILNENKPTKLTETLICNYFIEDTKKDGLSYVEAIRDISLELGRTKEYILKVLKGKGIL